MEALVHITRKPSGTAARAAADPRVTGAGVPNGSSPLTARGMGARSGRNRALDVRCVR